jgi:hypothetical protein
MVLRTGQRVQKRVPIADIASEELALELVPAPLAGWANVLTRFAVVYHTAGDDIDGVGADDNLVVRATDDDGSIMSQSITGVGFLDSEITTAFLGRVAGPADLQKLVPAAALVLAYTDSADGVDTTDSTGYLDVSVEYDLVYVGQ